MYTKKNAISRVVFIFLMVLVAVGVQQNAWAQEAATDLDCLNCVDNDDLAPNSTSWWNLTPGLRNGLTRQREDIDSLLGTNDSGLRVLAGGRQVGKLLEIRRSGGTPFALLVMTNNGYLAWILVDPDVVRDPFVNPPRQEGDLVQFATYYLGTGCVGTPYAVLDVPATGFRNGKMLFNQGFVAPTQNPSDPASLYYLPARSQPESVTFQSYYSIQEGGCRNVFFPNSLAAPLVPNIPSTTLIDRESYGGPVVIRP